MLFAAECARLRGKLEAAREASRQPGSSGCRDEVNDLLVPVELGEG